MEVKYDAQGNVYVDVHNVRVTKLEKTWEEGPGIRIQAYTGSGSSLHMGPEIPLGDSHGLELIEAIAFLLRK